MFKKLFSKQKGAELQHWEDGDFMDDVRQVTLRGAHPYANALFWTLGAFIFVFLLWASFFEIDEVTAGEGRVIPSSNMQVVQNREGGIVSDILVKEGDVVRSGDILVRLDNAEFFSSLEEKKTRELNLRVEVARLEAESEGKSAISFSSAIIEEAPKAVAQQRDLFKSRRQEFSQAIAAVQQKVSQKRQEIKTLQAKHTQLVESYNLSKKELDMTRPLLEEGVVSEVEVLRLERDVNDAKGKMTAAKSQVSEAQFGLQEVQRRLKEERAKQRSVILEELSEKRDELSRLQKISKTDEDRVARTAVRAPVNATVKRVLVNTVGGVIKPGMDLVELIPMEDSLLVETKIRPKDIAFLRPGQAAKVKFTAYDFTIYGGLDAQLEQIGIDTVADEDGNAFYHIRVRTDKNFLGAAENPLPIIPGMVASVDILTGKKTILSYLLKPFNKMRENAFRER